jgi:hypothetical protein
MKKPKKPENRGVRLRRTPLFSGNLQFRDPARFTKIGRDVRGGVLRIYDKELFT